MMTEREPPKRVRVFLATTFTITWVCWWGLVLLTRHGVVAYGQPLFMALYMLGGFGPTIAAYVAVTATRDVASVREFNSRLLRWRVGIVWYLVALGLPFAIEITAAKLTGALEPASFGRFAFKPWFTFLTLFPTMIVGGGLEELGWRGIAQPELERRMSRAAAALITGILWSGWHLPLFSLPGVGQYGTSFPAFAVGVVGLAFILAWLYAATGSILLCIICHAAVNTAGAMGYSIPADLLVATVALALFKLALGFGLVLATPGQAAWRDRGPVER